MKALVLGAFNLEKVLVWASSVIVKSSRTFVRRSNIECGGGGGGGDDDKQ